MKKILSVILMLVIAVSAILPASSAFAAKTAADGIAVVMDIGSASFEKTQYRTISYSVANYGKPADVRISVYLDDKKVTDSKTYYMVTDTVISKVREAYISPDLDINAQHCFKVKATCHDGSVKEKKVYFTLKKDLSASLKFMSYPEKVKLGKDVPLALKVSMPSTIKTYNLRTAVELNGTRISELENSLVAKDGQVIYLNIPGSYVKEDSLELNLKIIANPDAKSGEPTASAEIKIPVEGAKARMYEEVSKLVKPVIITAYVHTTTAAYANSWLTGYRATIPSGTYVAYLNPDNHNSMRAAKVRTQSGEIYWVPMRNIWISTEDYTIPDTLTKEQKESFVNGKGYSSKTSYLVWVNLERQILSVFLGKKGEWKFVDCFPVATGKNTTPTPTVEHEIAYVTRWVTPTYTCSPVLALYDGYAIHNQPVSPRGYVTDTTIGKPASAGCVRMLQKDINWVHAYVPVGSNVVIY